jgi:hypothetical protein
LHELAFATEKWCVHTHTPILVNPVAACSPPPLVLTAIMCRGLDRVRSKHIVDAALVLVQAPSAAGSVEEDGVRAALTLLERELVATPALTIAVLNTLPQHRVVLAGHLARFLQRYDAKCTS